jgi:predicted ATPase
MLTRLRVSGFKNLIDVDVWFGPFTCIAGANGVGKSNLMDAISFLSALADQPMMDAAMSVRDERRHTGDVRSLFHRVGNESSDVMSFEAEMIIPREGFDDLGQRATASSTFVRYSVEFRYRGHDDVRSFGALELVKEELAYIKLNDARKRIRFDHSQKWRESAVLGRRWTPYYISTDAETGLIRVHQDGGSSGKPRTLLAANLPRTVLSATNAAESPTATLARREMQSWRLLQLEPSALRRPDEFSAPVKIGSDGAHLPATLHRLSHPFSSNGNRPTPEEEDEVEGRVYSTVASTLSELLDDVRTVNVEKDERRELFTLFVTGRDGTAHPARALSDGTLRFLALAVLSLDSESPRVLCLEEPENGIHPERIPAMIRLLQTLAADVNSPVDSNNPLRQVIVNTHSPAFVLQVAEESLVVAEPIQKVRDGRPFTSLSFSCLGGTWRHKSGAMLAVPLGKLLAYLNPVIPVGEGSAHQDDADSRRVIDRTEIRQLTLFSEIQP